METRKHIFLILTIKRAFGLFDLGEKAAWIEVFCPSTITDLDKGPKFS